MTATLCSDGGRWVDALDEFEMLFETIDNANNITVRKLWQPLLGVLDNKQAETVRHRYYRYAFSGPRRHVGQRWRLSWTVQSLGHNATSQGRSVRVFQGRAPASRVNITLQNDRIGHD